MPDDPTEIEHVDQLLKFLKAMTGDERYAEILAYNSGEVKSMCDVAERLTQKGIQQGIQQGIAEGEKERKRLENENAILRRELEMLRQDKK